MSNEQDRLTALQVAASNGVFDAVLLGQHFWGDDPFDVPSVHGEARTVFANAVRSVSERRTSRLMLVLGDVGTGKTHLLRAFRRASACGALCAYTQFNAKNADFERHFLAQLVTSMSQPVEVAGKITSGFKIAYEAVQSAAPAACAELAVRWGDESPDLLAIARLVAQATDHAMERYGLSDADLNTIKAVINVNAPTYGVASRAKRFLRGEPLTALDQEFVPDLPVFWVSQYGEQLESLCRTLAALSRGSLVYFFDQAETLHRFGPDGLQRALDVIMALLDAVPHLLSVIAWEHTRFGLDFENLPAFVQDRLRNGVEQPLEARRTANEVRLLLQRRFDSIFATAGLCADQANPLDPLPADFPERLNGRTTRAVFVHAGQAIAGGPAGRSGKSATVLAELVETIDAEWGAALASTPESVDLPDSDLLEVVAWACANAYTEGDRVCSAQYVDRGQSGVLHWCDLDVQSSGIKGRLRLFGLTRKTLGKGLLRQIEAALQLQTDRILIGIRLGPFPKNPATQTVQRIGDLFASGGWRVLIPDTELQVMVAYRGFCEVHGQKEGFSEWASQTKMLEGLEVVRAILNGSQMTPKANPLY